MQIWEDYFILWRNILISCINHLNPDMERYEYKVVFI